MKEECLRFHLVTVLLPETRAFHRRHVTNASDVEAVASRSRVTNTADVSCGRALAGRAQPDWQRIFGESAELVAPAWTSWLRSAGTTDRCRRGCPLRRQAAPQVPAVYLPPFYHAERSLARALLRLLAARPDRSPCGHHLPASGAAAGRRAVVRRLLPAGCPAAAHRPARAVTHPAPGAQWSQEPARVPGPNLPLFNYDYVG